MLLIFAVPLFRAGLSSGLANIVVRGESLCTSDQSHQIGHPIVIARFQGRSQCPFRLVLIVRSDIQTSIHPASPALRPQTSTIEELKMRLPICINVSRIQQSYCRQTYCVDVISRP